MAQHASATRRVALSQCSAVKRQQRPQPAHSRITRFQVLQPRTSPISAWFSNSAALRSSFDKVTGPPRPLLTSSARRSLFGTTVQLPLPNCTAKVSAVALNLPFLPNPSPVVSSFSHTLARRFPTSSVPRFTFVFSAPSSIFLGLPASRLHLHYQCVCLSTSFFRREKG